MSIIIDITCDRCGVPTGKTVPIETGIIAFRALISTKGWRQLWAPPDARVQKAGDYCPGCADPRTTEPRSAK